MKVFSSKLIIVSQDDCRETVDIFIFVVGGGVFFLFNTLFCTVFVFLPEDVRVPNPANLVLSSDLI